MCYHRRLFILFRTECNLTFYCVDPAGRAATESGSNNGARTRPTAGMLDTSAANSPVHLQHRLTPKGGSIHGDKQKNCKKFGNQGESQGCKRAR
nr:hypothetical protein [Oxalobacteraceae bacterium]